MRSLYRSTRLGCERRAGVSVTTRVNLGTAVPENANHILVVFVLTSSSLLNSVCVCVYFFRRIAGGQIASIWMVAPKRTR